MGHNDHIADLRDDAIAIAVEAGAVTICPNHDDVWLDAGDPEANAKAYAIGTNYWKSGKLSCSREDLMAAIKDVIDWAVEECPTCAKIRDE